MIVVIVVLVVTVVLVVIVVLLQMLYFRFRLVVGPWTCWGSRCRSSLTPSDSLTIYRCIIHIYIYIYICLGPGHVEDRVAALLDLRRSARMPDAQSKLYTLCMYVYIYIYIERERERERERYTQASTTCVGDRPKQALIADRPGRRLP